MFSRSFKAGIPFLIYLLFTGYLEAPLDFHLHGFYGVKNKTYPNFLQHSVELFPCVLHGLVKQLTYFLFGFYK